MSQTTHFILINIGYAEHHADWNYKQVVSPFIRIYMVDKGYAKIHLQDSTIEMETGFLYIIPAYCMHNYECNEDFSLYYIHLYENECNNPVIGENYIFQHKIPINEIDTSLIKYLFKINPHNQLSSYNPKFYNNHTTFIKTIYISTQVPIHQQLETEGILQILVSHLLKYAKPQSHQIDDRIAKTLVYIRNNLSKAIEISELAKNINISTEYFTRLFTEELKEPPIKYIQKRKIQRAQLLLTIKDMPIKELAYSLGFNNVSYFNKVFKKITGYTPKEFKLQMFRRTVTIGH